MNVCFKCFSHHDGVQNDPKRCHTIYKWFEMTIISSLYLHLISFSGFLNVPTVKTTPSV